MFPACQKADLQVFLGTEAAVKVRVQDLVKKHKNLKQYVSFSLTPQNPDQIQMNTTANQYLII